MSAKSFPWIRLRNDLIIDVPPRTGVLLFWTAWADIFDSTMFTGLDAVRRCPKSVSSLRNGNTPDVRVYIKKHPLLVEAVRALNSVSVCEEEHAFFQTMLIEINAMLYTDNTAPKKKRRIGS